MNVRSGDRVYVLIRDMGYDGSEVVGVFSSPAAAFAERAKLPHSPADYELVVCGWSLDRTGSLSGQGSRVCEDATEASAVAAREARAARRKAEMRQQKVGWASWPR